MHSFRVLVRAHGGLSCIIWFLLLILAKLNALHLAQLQSLGQLVLLDTFRQGYHLLGVWGTCSALHVTFVAPHTSRALYIDDEFVLRVWDLRLHRRCIGLLSLIRCHHGLHLWLFLGRLNLQNFRQIYWSLIFSAFLRDRLVNEMLIGAKCCPSRVSAALVNKLLIG